LPSSRTGKRVTLSVLWVRVALLDGKLALASHWVVAEVSIEALSYADMDGVIRGIALVLGIIAFIIYAIVTEFWPIILPIVIFAIGLIAYYWGWWPFGILRKNKKAVDPPDNGPGSLH